MAINKSLVPDVHPGTLRAEYRVDGDRPYATYPTEVKAKTREAELATQKCAQR